MENNYTVETEPVKESTPGKGLSIAGMIFGIVSIVTGCCYGGVLGIPGLILSIIGNKKSKNGLAIAGIVTSIIGILWFIVLIVLVIITIVTGEAMYNSDFYDYVYY